MQFIYELQRKFIKNFFQAIQQMAYFWHGKLSEHTN